MKDIQPIEENEDLNENHQSEEKLEDEVEKVDIDLDRLKEFLSQCEISSISSDTKSLCLAAIVLYSKKYKEALKIVQDPKIMIMLIKSRQLALMF